MSEADQFREYAQEALQWATQSTIEKEKRALLELARTWTSEGRMVGLLKPKSRPQ
jgi:hypothetical protein